MTSFITRIPSPPRMLNESEQAALLQVTGLRRDGFRDHIIFAIALGTGLREHEITALNVGDILDDDGKVRRRIRLSVFKRSSSKPPLQEILLNETLRTKLARFIKHKKSAGHSIEPDAPLLMSRNGNRLSTRQLRHMFAVWLERAGIDQQYTFHSLRHCACSNLYRRTKDLRIVQRFARHASILSTMRYSHPDEGELIRALQDLPC